MKVFDGFASITISIEDGNITLSQAVRYSTESITFPVSQWGHLAAAVSSEAMNPTPEPTDHIQAAQVVS